MNELPTALRIAFSIVGLIVGALLVVVAWHYQRRRTWIKVKALVVDTEFDMDNPQFVALTVTYPVKTDSRAGDPANEGARPPFPYQSTVHLNAAMCEKAFGGADVRRGNHFLNLPINVWYTREFPTESYYELQVYSRRFVEAIAGFCVGASILVASMWGIF